MCVGQVLGLGWQTQLQSLVFVGGCGHCLLRLCPLHVFDLGLNSTGLQAGIAPFDIIFSFSRQPKYWNVS
jgi:hypothetical protein